VFEIRRRGLRLFDRALSGGLEPVSVAVQDDRAYVLNAGEPNNITGFDIGGYGGLKPLPGSTRRLSDPNAGPAQVGFSPNGAVLAVSERLTHRLLAFPLSPSGPGTPSILASAKPRPFGFAFHAGNLVVSEAGGADGVVGASSYRLAQSRKLRLVSSPVFPGQRGACWTAVTSDGRYAYVTNTGTDTITGVRLGPRGRMELLDPSGASAQLGPMTRPTDVVSAGRYLYVLGVGSNTVSSFAIARSGALTPVDSVRVADGALTGLASAPR
jgi:6-phosphogluconolactonase (cycloisomerase 2 family)